MPQMFLEGIDEPVRDSGARRVRAEPKATAHLFRVLDCERPAASTSRHALANIDEVVIGRGSGFAYDRVVRDGCRTLELRLPDRRVSTHHARLVRRGAGWKVEDLASRNGTRVDAAPVSEAELPDSALIQVGQTFLRFSGGLSTPADSPGDIDSGDLMDRPTAFVTLMPELFSDLSTLARISGANLPILLQGETGCGKELLVRAIHERSGRPGKLVAVNCGAIPETLLEAQLFGHIKGAFSGAARDELGYVRAADGGTLFLDEIGDLPMPSQVALLRALQEREVVPVGATKPIPVDLRVVAATHAPIDALTRQARFRDDLLARLSGFRFEAPPLRARGGDMGVLIANVLRELAPDRMDTVQFESEAGRLLLSHTWPHNIRELHQCLSAALVLCGDGPIAAEHLSEGIRKAADTLTSTPGPSPGPRADADVQLREELLAHFAACGGNVSEVARRMGKARVQIQRWMKRLSIDPTVFR